MTYKTIVVHLADDPKHMSRLRLAVGLAKRFDAHLNVVYATEQVDVPAPAIGRAASMAFLEEASETARKYLEMIAKETKEQCASLPSQDWHIERRADFEKGVARYVHLADLAVVEQPS